MKKSLEMLLTPIFLASTIAFLSPSSVRADHFEYFTQARNTTHTSQERPIKKGLSSSQPSKRYPVNNIGAYQELVDAPESDTRFDVDVEVRYRPNMDMRYSRLQVAYAREKTSDEEINGFRSESSFYEDTGRTSIYVAVPREVDVLTLRQRVHAHHNKTGSEVSLYAVPFEDTKVSALLAKINNAFDGKDGPSKDELNELERTLNRIIDAMPGTWGKVTKEVKDYVKSYLLAQKSERLRALQEKFPGYKVMELPFHEANGEDLFEHTVLGRETKMLFKTTRLKGKAQGYVIVPQIAFRRKTTESGLETAEIGGMVYEFEIEGMKGIVDDE